MRIFFKLGDKLIANVDDLAVIIHIVAVIANYGNIYLVGFSVWIPEGINIEPGIKRRQEQYRKNDCKGEEVPA